MRKLFDAIFMYFMVDLMRGSYARIYLAIMCLVNLFICFVVMHQNEVIQVQRILLRQLMHDWVSCTGQLLQKK